MRIHRLRRANNAPDEGQIVAALAKAGERFPGRPLRRGWYAGSPVVTVELENGSMLELVDP